MNDAELAHATASYVRSIQNHIQMTENVKTCKACRGGVAAVKKYLTIRSAAVLANPVNAQISKAIYDGMTAGTHHYRGCSLYCASHDDLGFPKPSTN